MENVEFDINYEYKMIAKTQVFAMIFLQKYNHLVIGGSNGIIYFYHLNEKQNKYELIDMLNSQNNAINCLIQLSNIEEIVSSSLDNTIKVFELASGNDGFYAKVKQKIIHPSKDGVVSSIIEIKSNIEYKNAKKITLVSSDIKEVLIWQRDEKNKDSIFVLFKKISCSGNVVSLIELDNDTFIGAQEENKLINFFNSNVLEITCKVKLMTVNKMPQILEKIPGSNILFIGGNREITLVDSKEHQIIKKLRIGNFRVHSILFLEELNCLIVGCETCLEKKYEIKIFKNVNDEKCEKYNFQEVKINNKFEICGNINNIILFEILKSGEKKKFIAIGSSDYSIYILNFDDIMKHL